MKKRSTEKPVRKTYTPPKLVVYGRVSELTQAAGRGGGNGRGGNSRGGKGRGHGGARS